MKVSKTIILDDEDMKTLRKLKSEQIGISETVDEFVRAVAVRKGKIIESRSEFWDQAYPKYKLDNDKDYTILTKTGEIVEVPKVGNDGVN